MIQTRDKKRKEHRFWGRGNRDVNTFCSFLSFRFCSGWLMRFLFVVGVCVFESFGCVGRRVFFECFSHFFLLFRVRPLSYRRRPHFDDVVVFSLVFSMFNRLKLSSCSCCAVGLCVGVGVGFRLLSLYVLTLTSLSCVTLSLRLKACSGHLFLFLYVKVSILIILTHTSLPPSLPPSLRSLRNPHQY